MVTLISFQTFFVQAFKIVVDSWKFTILLLYILWNDRPIFMISGSNEQLQQQLEYTLLKPDCHVSIETISAQFDVSVGTVHTIIREELKICAKFVPRVLREDQKERRCHDSRFMVELINSDPAVLDALVTCDESWINCYDLETKRQSSQWKHAGSLRPKKARQSKSTHKLLMIPFFFWQHWHDL